MEKKRIDEDAETDLLGEVVIDERYNALARENSNSTSGSAPCTKPRTPSFSASPR
jgi:hypothetical protein